jgi:hypothetical protein
MHLYIEISKKKIYIWSCLLVAICWLKKINRFASWENPYIGWNSLLKCGLEGSQTLYGLLVLIKVSMITLSSSSIIKNEPQLLLCILMICH